MFHPQTINKERSAVSGGGRQEAATPRGRSSEDPGSVPVPDPVLRGEGRLNLLSALRREETPERPSGSL